SDAVVLEARAHLDGLGTDAEIYVSAVGERALRRVRHVEQCAAERDLRTHVEIEVLDRREAQVDAARQDLQIRIPSGAIAADLRVAVERRSDATASAEVENRARQRPVLVRPHRYEGELVIGRVAY